jgi:hypothetical protein
LNTKVAVNELSFPLVTHTAYLSVLHYRSFLGTSQFTPSTIFSLSHFTPSAILHSQPLYIISHFIHSVILRCKQFYNLSNFIAMLFYPLSHFYTFMSSHYFLFLFLQISMLLREDDKQLLKYICMRYKAEDLIHASFVSHFLPLLYSKALFAIHL